MKKEEAISYLQQLYPNGGHCWLDEQRIEAIGMAIKALQDEPVSEDLESEIQRYYVDWDEHPEYVQTARHFAKWQKEQMMSKAIDSRATSSLGSPCIAVSYWADTGLALGDKCKMILIKEE